MSYNLSIYPSESLIKGLYYVPRKSVDNFWLTNYLNGTLSDGDLVEDFTTMKTLCGINTIRIFIFYDIEYRKAVMYNISVLGMSQSVAEQTATTNLVGLTNGNGVYNEALFTKLSHFIDLAGQNGLDVIPTLFQELSALRATDDWTFLESKLSYFKDFTTKIVTIFASKPNVKHVMLKNEPDGYGVWDNYSLASRVLTFLYELKQSALSVSHRLKYIVNSVTHDNIYKKYPNTICNSIYSLTDVVCVNSFLHTDTGFWSGISYRTQFDYIKNNNYLNKDIIMTECGFPTDYVNQRVVGEYDIDGNLSSVTDDSTIPINDGIFDRPVGRTGGITHSEQHQYEAISEAIYWVTKYKLKGFLVWSAFQHPSNGIQDSFSVINYDNTPKLACDVIKNAYYKKINDTFGNRVSLQQGSITGSGKISGLTPYDVNNVGMNVVNGIRVESSSNWISETLLYDYPFSYKLNLKYRSNVDEPFTVGIVTNETSFQLRYKKYDKNGFELYDLGNNVSIGWSQALNIARNVNFDLTIELKGNSPIIYYNGTVLNFGATMDIKPYQLNNIRLQIFGIQSPIEFNSLYRIGNINEAVNLTI